MKIKRKVIWHSLAWLMILATLISSVPGMQLRVFSTGPTTVTVTKDGVPVTNFSMTDEDKILLSAAAENADGMQRAWQILDQTGESRWIDITDAVGESLYVTYSLIGSMLDQKNTAKLRCVARDGEQVYASQPVTVAITQVVTEQSQIIQSAPQRPARMYASRAGSDTEEELETYTIVINYLFDNGGIAFEPYGASVAKGSDFSADITSPSVVGYKPLQRGGQDYVDASVVSLNYTNIQQNITINVIYEPDLVNFSVHHHLQNLHDDDYSVYYDLITTSQALTGTLVPLGLALTEAQLPGFRALTYERLPVAADGSTVVEIRYDRNYYLIDFDNNGGYGAEPVYTRYGATVGANVPTRHGYVFDGWELVAYGDSVPTTEQKSKYEITGTQTILVPEVNLRYRARWITQETEYTMVFWKENANDNGYSYCGYLDGLRAMSGSYVSAADRLSEVPGIDDARYFTFNAAKSDKNVLVEGDGSTVVNVYYTRNYYTLTFKAAGLCSIPEKHTHTAACYDTICGLGHVHTDDCNPTLDCTLPEHTAHSSACLICELPEHIHGSLNCNCSLAEHTHTTSCWSNVGTAQTPNGAPSNPENGYIYRRNNNYYIYIQGKWYRYSTWGASNGDIVDPKCGKEEHSHGVNCNCGLQNHTHSDACYADALHTHDATCYTYSCGTVSHIHDQSCQRLKCAIKEGHTHTSDCKNSGKTNVVRTEYRKYQQSIADLWPVVDDNGKVYDNGERWKPSDSSYYSAVLVYLSHMPADDFVLSLDEASHTPYVMNYYFQALDDESYTKTYGNYRYNLGYTVRAKYNYVTKAEDFFDVAGFTQYTSNPTFNSSNQISISGNNRNIDFYYNRNVYKLEFNNNGVVLDNKTVNNLMYGASLESYYFVPDYPNNLEPKAYTFGGWYTSPGCYDGTEVDWGTFTVGDGDVLLYAKWEPVKHTVKVFKDQSMTEQIGSTQLVNHNAFAHAPDGQVENGNYIFQGWFYLDEENGSTVKKAFTFTGIPVRDDMNIFAEWGSHVSVDYTIRYVLKETGEEIAAPTYGSAIAGNNKTFEAKAGDDLYEAFRTGFYPLTNSHTITMSVDGTHEFTFEYVYVESMPYLVRYVNALTGETVLEEKRVMQNGMSVVTETFVKVDKMMPDAYQKRLVLSASGEDADQDGILDNNVITFYYQADEVHAYYQVIHYIQNISGDIYREYRTEEQVGIIGHAYSVEALSLAGFSFNGTKTKINGIITPITNTTITQTLGEDGILIELYYDRNLVNYTVQFVKSGTKEPLLPPKVNTGLFGEQVLEYAADLTEMGYVLVSDNLKILSLSANEAHNVIEFAYQEAFVSIKYEIVGSDGCGALSQYSENVAAISGRPNGSEPNAAEGYLFDGWYLDPACTIPVDANMINAQTNGLTPVKTDAEIWHEGQIYYAKFLAKETDLTIQSSGADPVDGSQMFLFQITGVAGTTTEGISLTVCIQGNQSVTITKLPVGKYTITEKMDWSWRYENSAAVRIVELSYSAAENVFSFYNSREGIKWLDGNADSNNQFQ